MNIFNLIKFLIFGKYYNDQSVCGLKFQKYNDENILLNYINICRMCHCNANNDCFIIKNELKKRGYKILPDGMVSI